MTPLNRVFDVEYGNKFDLNKMELLSKAAGGINFVNRSSRNCGVSATVAPVAGTPPYEAGNITVSLGGSYLLSSFVQLERFYTGQNVAVLLPKEEMSFAEKLYICLCIRHNRFRYTAFGREANRTLRTLLVPDRSEFPSWLDDSDVTQLETEYAQPHKSIGPVALNTRDWKWFSLSEIFDIRKGKRLTKAKMRPGGTPFISAIDSNNGLRQRVSAAPMHPANVITVNYNGNGVAEAFYQPEPFFASDDVNVLYPRFDLDSAVALFICTVIRREKYRFNYGRKWNMERMNESRIRLPGDASGAPDWQWMRQYILSQNFSSQLHEDESDTAVAERRLAEISADPTSLVEGEALIARLARIESVASLYGFAYTETALRYLESTVPAKIRGQIKRRIEALAANPKPPGCKRLVGVMDTQLDGEWPVYRVRQGDYRILYSVRPIIIVILDIGHRKEVYR
jgi:mRNA-degrading endonuclease RelE of RelBE toxin-antitoxin system